jgi:speckle-type POZ protein
MNYATSKVGGESSASDTFVTEVARMLDDELLVDFSIKSSDGEVLKAHKFILAARSPVFFTMLTSEMKEARESIVTVPDCNAEVLKALLSFIYSGNVKNIDETARELIYAAEKYQLKVLKEMCIESIVTSMTKDNVVESLIISEHIVGTEKVFSKCAHFLLR